MQIEISDLKSGYVPGIIGRVTELHAIYYNKHWGLDVNFESQVATELSEFFLQFDWALDGFWIATLDGKIVGSIAIQSSKDSDKSARLRWFILAPECQGQGVGKALIQKAINYCQKANFSELYLWTFAGLEAACRLYEKFGFILCEEYKDELWGNQINHQKFILKM